MQCSVKVLDSRIWIIYYSFVMIRYGTVINKATEAVYGTVDPDPYQNVTEPEHWIFVKIFKNK